VRLVPECVSSGVGQITKFDPYVASRIPGEIQAANTVTLGGNVRIYAVWIDHLSIVPADPRSFGIDLTPSNFQQSLPYFYFDRVLVVRVTRFSLVR
jgi:hypothetical protein